MVLEIEPIDRAPRNVEAEHDPALFAELPKQAKAALFPVPQPEMFGGREFLPDAKLKKLAQDLIDRYPAMAHIKTMDVRFFWKKSGGEAKGRPILGKTTRTGGLLREAMNLADFVVWVAADNTQGFSRHQMEAVMYHELCHVGRDQAGRGVLIPHDVEAFASEVREFGLWKPDLAHFGQAVKQLGLDLD